MSSISRSWLNSIDELHTGTDHRQESGAIQPPPALPGHIEQFECPIVGGRDLSPRARRAVLRQFIYYFFSYRQGRHPMVGGVWQIRPEIIAARRFLASSQAKLLLH